MNLNGNEGGRTQPSRPARIATMWYLREPTGTGAVGIRDFTIDLAAAVLGLAEQAPFTHVLLDQRRF